MERVGEKGGHCLQCDSMFSCYYNACRHFKMRHVKREEKYPCPVCFKELSHPYLVKDHLRNAHAIYQSDIKKDKAKSGKKNK